jgi:hypothetical protein
MGYYAINPRSWRSLAYPLQQGFESFSGTFSDQIHGAIGFITYPSCKPQAAGMVLHKLPKPYTLDAPLHTGL